VITTEKPPDVLTVRSLATRIHAHKSVVQAVDGVDLHLAPGETLGLVGESGCGKSMTGLSILGLLPTGGAVNGGSIELAGRELVGLPERDYRAIRGNEVAMVFQDSLTALDPTKTIGYQIAEPVRLHRGATRKAALDRALEVLSWVGVPQPRERIDQYPHQLSGGLRQRVMIAMALACEPKVLIADEPTTALDVTTQAQILRLLDDLKSRLGMAMLLITHDMGVIAEWADRVDIMYAGQVVEEAATETLFSAMRHPYTQALLASIPTLGHDRRTQLFSIPGLPPDLTDPPVGCRFAARCAHADDRCRTAAPPVNQDAPGQRYACWHPVRGPLAPTVATAIDRRAPNPAAPADRPVLQVVDLVKEYRVRKGTVKAVSGVSFEVRPGETFGLVGESGCGKSTLGRMLVALEKPDSGTVVAGGADLASLSGRGLRSRRRDLQMVFQDPFDSLDPRMRVAAIMREPLGVQRIGGRREQLDRVRELLAEVGLPQSALERYPHEFSGGQRQRIGIARALALHPQLIVADEPVSALDVSIRSQILNLMKRLQQTHGLTYVVISHDLTVVKQLADRIGVMYLGKLVEVGSGTDIYQRPAHPYAAGLIDAIPIPDPQRRGRVVPAIEGELPSAVNPPSGCRFRTRCPFAQERCALETPALRTFDSGHTAACHFPLREPLADAPLAVATDA
jgi:oligopeptide/dipeptide ABC transporter ATP-binding protein